MIRYWKLYAVIVAAIALIFVSIVAFQTQNVASYEINAQVECEEFISVVGDCNKLPLVRGNNDLFVAFPYGKVYPLPLPGFAEEALIVDSSNFNAWRIGISQGLIADFDGNNIKEKPSLELLEYAKSYLYISSALNETKGGINSSFYVAPENEVKKIRAHINGLLPITSSPREFLLSLAFVFVKDYFYADAIRILWGLPPSIERNLMLAFSLKKGLPTSKQKNNYIQGLLKNKLFDKANESQKAEADFILNQISDLCE